MGGPHRVKDPKVATVVVTNAKLQRETLYVFKDASAIGRKLHLSNSTRSVQSEELLHPTLHLHERQGVEYLKHSSQMSLADSNISDLLVPNSCLCTLGDYYQRLHKKPMPVGSDALVAPKPAESAQDELDVEVPNRHDDEEGDDDDDADEDGKCVSVSAAPQRKLTSIFQTPVDPGKQQKKRKAVVEQLLGKSVDSVESKKSAFTRSDSGSVSALDVDDTKSVAASVATQKTTTKNLSPQEQVQQWKGKIDITKVVQGTKLGVLIRHAEGNLPKLPTKERLDLEGYLALVKDGLNFAPDQIQTLSKDVLNNSYLKLKDAFPDLAWPLDVQNTLFDKATAEMVDIAKTALDEKVVLDFWKTVRPYHLDEKAEELNLTAITLCSMSLSEAAKTEKFEGILLDFILKLILQGSARYPVLVFHLKAILGFITEDLLLETLSDPQVQCLFSLQAACKALIALGEPTWELEESVVELKDACTQADSTMKHIYNAIKKEEFWNGKFQAWLATHRAVQLHEKKMESLRDFAATPVLLDGLETEKAMDLMREFAVVESEVPEGHLAPLKEAFVCKLKSMWDTILKGFADGVDSQSLEISKVQSFLQEGNITFNQDDFWQNASSSFQETLKTSAGTKKVEGMVKALNYLSKSVENCASQDVAKVCSQVLAAEGVEVPQAGATSMAAAWQSLCLRALTHVDDITVVQELGILLDKTIFTEPHLPPDFHAAARVKKIKGIASVVLAVRQFQGDMSEIGQMLAKDTPDKQNLANLMRISSVPSSWSSELEGWGSEKWGASVGMAPSLVQEAKTHVMLEAATGVSNVITKVRQSSSEKSDFLEWDQGLAQNAGFEKLSTAASNTLLVEGTLTIMKELIADLKKAFPKTAKYSHKQGYPLLNQEAFLPSHVLKQLVLHDTKQALEDYKTTMGFFKEKPDATTVNDAETLLQKLEAGKASGMIIHLFKTDDKVAKRKGLLGVVKHISASKFPVRNNLLEKARKACTG
eukprot:6490393-Amphidinium_carterae.3